MKNEKQTALDYYSKKIGKLMRYAITGSITGNQFSMLEIKLFEESKDMEKEQIVDAIDYFKKRPYTDIEPEQYYETTYGGDK